MILHLPFANWPRLWMRPEEIEGFRQNPTALPNNVAFVLWRNAWHLTTLRVWTDDADMPYFCSPFSTSDDAVSTDGIAPFAMRTLPVPISDLMDMKNWMQNNADSVNAWAKAQGQRSPNSLQTSTSR